MRLANHLSAESVFILRGITEKEAFLRQLVHLVHPHCPVIAEETVLQRLQEREAQVTTGIGHGVAIPHATVEGLEETQCYVIQSPEGVDYQSLDSSLVHITFLLLSPPGKTGTHIRMLARIARLADSEAFIARIATAPSEEELHRLLVEEDGRHV